jgi:acyl carrier protein
MSDAANDLGLEAEIKRLIVSSLRLEGIQPEDIDPEATLVGRRDGRGLDLDSIDVLELAMALQREYGVKTAPDDAENQRIFASVRSLADWVARTRPA